MDRSYRSVVVVDGRGGTGRRLQSQSIGRIDRIDRIDRSYWLLLLPEDRSVVSIRMDGINRSVGFDCRLLLPIDFEKLHNGGMNPAAGGWNGNS